MRTARIITNETCNQACRFCDARRPVDDPARVRARAVASQIARALEAGAQELVFTGGEPTMRRDLASLVGFARSRGDARLVLETNGALLDRGRVSELAEAGLDEVRVHLPGWEEGHEAVARDPGSFPAVLDTMRAVAGAGLAFSVAVPLVRSTVDAAPALPGRLAAAGLEPRIVLVPVVRSPAPDELLRPSEMASGIEAVADECRRYGLGCTLGSGTFLPPCAFDDPKRAVGLYALTPGGGSRAGHAHTSACDGCVVRDRCPGVAEEHLAGPEPFQPRPIESDKVRRRLAVISTVDEQVARELVSREIARYPDGRELVAHTVRVNFHCNQSCEFCFVSTHLPPAQDAAIRAAIEEIAGMNGLLALSGGEPTLNPRLAEYVRLGRERGAAEIELQTNAILLDDERVAELEQAGVTVAHVSLHGSHAELSDRITGAPGTFAKTVRGIDALARSGIRLRLNFVFCHANQGDFPAYVSFVAERWPSATATVSFIAQSTDVVPRGPIMPRYTDIAPSLAEGLRRAKAAGLVVGGFDSMCGLPLCVVPDDLSAMLALPEVDDAITGGEFVRPDACAVCVMNRHCFGVRRGYAAAYGLSEFTALDADSMVARRLREPAL